MRVNQLDELIVALVDHRVRLFTHDKERVEVLMPANGGRGMIRLECGTEINVPGYI